MSRPLAFLSHSSADKQLARGIADALRSGGVEVWIDDEQIGFGDSIPRRIEDGLARSDVLLVLVSESFKQSSWCRAEYEPALVREIEQGTTTVIPLRLDGAELPLLLAAKRYVDLRTGDADLQLLIRSLHSASRDPTPAAHRERRTSAGKTAKDADRFNPEPIYRRVRLEDFVGRRWLEHDLDSFIEAHPSGYWILEAKAGTGKTSFVAHLARERCWVHHFVQQAPGPAGILACRRHLAAQLLASLDVSERATSALPDPAEPHFLASLLEFVAERQPNHPLTVVIDGLDEAGAFEGENVLGLPSALPTGTFIVATTRPVPVRLSVDGPERRVRLDPASDENLADIRSYIAAKLGDAFAPGTRDGPAHDVVDHLTSASGGVWVYVRYVLAELDRTGDVARLSDLPRGLWNYYYHWWAGWKEEHPRSWRTVDLPILCTLACARAPMTVSQLAAINDTQPETVADLLERWLPFLDVDQTRATHRRRFSIFHTSLTRFLSGDENDALQGEVAMGFAADLGEGVRAAHRRVADRYISSWGGLDSGLAGLGEGVLRNLDDGYGLRNVIHHLVAVDDDSLAQAIIESQWADAPNAWHEAHMDADTIDDYLTDVLVLRERAHAATRRQLESQAISTSAGLEFGLALLMRTAKLQAQGISNVLRAALVRHRLWSPSRAISSARMLGADSAEALARIASVLDGQEARTLWDEALETARLPVDPIVRSNSLRALLPLAPENDRTSIVADLLALARSSRSARVMQLTAIAPNTDGDGVWREALVAVDDCRDDTIRSVDLQSLARKAPAGLFDDICRAAIGLPLHSRASVLFELLPRLEPEIARREATSLLLEATSSHSTFSLHSVIVGVAKWLPDERLDEAFASTERIKNVRDRAFAVAALLRRLPPDRRREPRTTLIPEVLALPDPDARTWARVRLACALTGGELTAELRAVVDALEGVRPDLRLRVLYHAFAAAESDDDHWLLAEALPRAATTERTYRGLLAGLVDWVIVHLGPLDHGRARDVVLSTLIQSRSDDVRAHGTAKLTPLTENDDMQSLVEVIRGIADPDRRAVARLALAESATGLLRQELLDDAVAATRPKRGPFTHAALLTSLLGRLPPPMREPGFEEALRAIRRVRSGSHRGALLAELADCARSERRAALLSEAEQAIAETREPAEEASHLVALLAHVADDDERARLAEHAVELALRTPNVIRGRVLSGKRVEDIPELAGPLLARAMEVEEWDRGQLLIEIAPVLPAGLYSQAFVIAKALSAFVQPWPLVRLCIAAPESLRPSFLPATLAVVRDQRGWSRGSALVALTEHVRDLAEEALEAIRGVEGEVNQAALLARLAPFADGPVLDRFAAVAGGLGEPLHRARVLVSLVGAAGGQATALNAARSAIDKVAHAGDRADLLVTLAEQLGAPDGCDVASEALPLCLNVDATHFKQLRVLTRLIPLLPTDALAIAVDTVGRVSDDYTRSRLLAEIAPRLPAWMTSDALLVARTIESTSMRGSALEALCTALIDREVHPAHQVWMDLMGLAARGEMTITSDVILSGLASFGGAAACKEAWRWCSAVEGWWPSE
jgi:hypothetical protein